MDLVRRRVICISPLTPLRQQRESSDVHQNVVARFAGTRSSEPATGCPEEVRRRRTAPQAEPPALQCHTGRIRALDTGTFANPANRARTTQRFLLDAESPAAHARWPRFKEDVASAPTHHDSANPHEGNAGYFLRASAEHRVTRAACP